MTYHLDYNAMNKFIEEHNRLIDSYKKYSESEEFKKQEAIRKELMKKHQEKMYERAEMLRKKEQQKEQEEEELRKNQLELSRIALENARIENERLKNTPTIQESREQILKNLLAQLQERQLDINLQSLPYSRADMLKMLEESELFNGLSDDQFATFFKAQRLCKLRRGRPIK
jgi:hypothetical protein